MKEIPCISLGYVIASVIVIVFAVIILSTLLPETLGPLISTGGSLTITALVLWYVASWLLKCKETRRVVVQDQQAQ